MRKKIRLYFTFMGVALRAKMMHRGAFIAGFFGQLLGHGGRFLTAYLAVRAFRQMGGWNEHQVVFMYGFNMLGYALAASVFFMPCKYLVGKVRSGEFDASLTKPMNPLLHEVMLGFSPGYICHFSLAVVCLAISARGAGFVLTPLRAVLFVVLLAGAVLMQAAILIIPSAGSFFFKKMNPIYLLTGMAHNFIDYPLTIYPRALQALLTFVLPLAFMSFYPVTALLGLESLLPFPPGDGLFRPAGRRRPVRPGAVAVERRPEALPEHGHVRPGESAFRRFHAARQEKLCALRSRCAGMCLIRAAKAEAIFCQKKH